MECLDVTAKIRTALVVGLVLACTPGAWTAGAWAHGDGAPEAGADGHHGEGDSADDFETKHIFGFTEGTDVGDAGDKEMEFTTNGSIGKRGGGGYNAIEQKGVYEAAPSDRFGYEVGPLGLSQQIANVPGLSNLSQTNFAGVAAEPKYIFVKRGIDAPFGLAVSVAPEWDRIDPVSGAHVSNFVLETKTLSRLGTDREEALCRRQSCLCAGDGASDRRRIQSIRPCRSDGRADLAHHAVTRYRRRDRILRGL